MKQVLLRPSFNQEWCGNRIFSEGTSHGGLYQSAFAKWREKAEKQGFAIDTWDMQPLQDTDVLWLLDLPRSRREYEALVARVPPSCKIVVQTFETPVIAWNVFHKENTSSCDAVVTYEHDDNCTGNHGLSCFHFRLPTQPMTRIEGPSFKDRKGLVVLNGNRVEGLWAPRQLGIAGLPLMGRVLSGWQWVWSDVQPWATSDLYSERRRLLRQAQYSHPGFVDLYGSGWNGESISWCPLYPNRPYSLWRGTHAGRKLDLVQNYRFLLSYENYRGSRGYISEKLFDGFFAGAVPVYLGDERIHEIVPSAAYVDARNFPNPRELLQYLEGCSEDEWLAMRGAAAEFLQSEEFSPFSDLAFAEKMTDVLVSVV